MSSPREQLLNKKPFNKVKTRIFHKQSSVPTHIVSLLKPSSDSTVWVPSSTKLKSHCNKDIGSASQMVTIFRKQFAHQKNSLFMKPVFCLCSFDLGCLLWFPALLFPWLLFCYVPPHAFDFVVADNRLFMQMRPRARKLKTAAPDVWQRLKTASSRQLKNGTCVFT